MHDAPPSTGGLEVSDAKRLKALEGESAKLKKMLAESMLDNAFCWQRLGGLG